MIDDIDRIMQVMQVAFDPQYGEAWTRSQVENALLMGNCHAILVDARGRPPAEGEPAAGFILSRSGADEEELLLLAVAPEHRRCGLGTQMLRRLFHEAGMRRVTQIHLEMRHGNDAEGLYRSHGFEPVGRRPNYYRTSSGERIDAVTFCYRV